MYGPLYTTRQILYDCMHCRTFLCVFMACFSSGDILFRKRVSCRFKWPCSNSTSSSNDDTDIRAKLKKFLCCSRRSAYKWKGLLLLIDILLLGAPNILIFASFVSLLRVFLHFKIRATPAAATSSTSDLHLYIRICSRMIGCK